MDLLHILRSKIDRLPTGEHTAGLRSVFLHIQTAESHHTRGLNGDETAFTDSIYRTNQAFEGSLKEAYRVLAEKPPEKKTPNQIEEYLTNNDIFRRRILLLLTNYRTEWRNPSTHDHKLDFDANEALLAIVSVSAFANLLLDQIAEKIARENAKAAAEAEREKMKSLHAEHENDFPLYIGHLTAQFLLDFEPKHQTPRMRDAELLGALSGFLETVVPDTAATIEFPLAAVGHERADLLVSRQEKRLIVELKRSRTTRQLVRSALEQIDRYSDLSGISDALLVLDGDGNAVTVDETKTPLGRRVIVIQRGPGPA
jgi:hypothetical protein